MAAFRQNGAAISHSIADNLGDWRDEASDDVEQVRTKAHDVERTLQQFIQKQPIRTLVIGASIVDSAGVGVVLGGYWVRKK